MENNSKENISRFHLKRINGSGTTSRITVSIWQQEFGPDVFPDGPLAIGWGIEIVNYICGCVLEGDHHFEWIPRLDLDFDLTRILEQYIHSRLAGIAKLISIFLIFESDPGRLHHQNGLTTRQQEGGQDEQKVEIV